MRTLFEKNMFLNEAPMIDGDRGPIKVPRKKATKYAQTMSGAEPTLMDDPGTVMPQEKITRVTYHMTEVFVFNHNTREVTLNNGGWLTQTTKERMNMMSEQLNLGFGVSQVRGNWFVSSHMFTNKLEFQKNWITFNVDTGEEKDYMIE